AREVQAEALPGPRHIEAEIERAHEQDAQRVAHRSVEPAGRVVVPARDVDVCGKSAAAERAQELALLVAPSRTGREEAVALLGAREEIDRVTGELAVLGAEHALEGEHRRVARARRARGFVGVAGRE